MSNPKKPIILFVDDEENVLRGLSRMLRAKRNVWDFRFAQSGSQALEMMKEVVADVVVSDMRMPIMTGAELLSTVKELYPGTIRIVLSGFAEREAILKTIGPSHRYLAKPVSEDILITSIENALSLRAYIVTDSVQKTIAALTHLPTLPKIYLAILEELNSEIGSADRLTTIIEKDIGISAQLMRLTNSAYFSMPQRCTTVRQAINILGFDNVRATVLLAGVFEQFRKINASMSHVVERLMERSLALGILSQAIARHEGWSSEQVDQAFCAGLLAHVGTLVLIAHDPEAFGNCMQMVERGEGSLIDIEKKMFGASHAQLGAYLLGLWGFADPIVEAIAFHHNPSAYAKQHIQVLTAVHVAQYLARNRAQTPETRKGTDGGLDRVYCEHANIEGLIPEWAALFDRVTQDWPHE